MLVTLSRRFDNHFVDADAIPRSVEIIVIYLCCRVRCQRGYLFGTTRTLQPVELAAALPSRNANTSGGVRSSWPAQNATKLRVRGRVDDALLARPVRPFRGDDHPLFGDRILSKLGHKNNTTSAKLYSIAFGEGANPLA